MTTGSSSLVKKFLVFPPKYLNLVADPANLACSAGHSSKLVGPNFCAFSQCTLWVHQCEVVFFLSCEQFPHVICFRQAVLLLHTQGSWNYLAKEFSSQVRIFTRVLGVHTLGPSV